jgi:prepilin signal peptidase PulO-like enzyme (type II secretory pathway)
MCHSHLNYKSGQDYSLVALLAETAVMAVAAVVAAVVVAAVVAAVVVVAVANFDHMKHMQSGTLPGTVVMLLDRACCLLREYSPVCAAI